MDSENLIELATEARENAYAPYSNFKVGAALLASNDRVFTGCNVENATYGLTVCAERVALWKAVSEGERKFVAVAVVADGERPPSPCGACRQLLWEFSGDIEVITANLRGARQSYHLSELLPHPFDRSFL
jgi:cytidine deaminase